MLSTCAASVSAFGRRSLLHSPFSASRGMSTKVTVLGASGGIGQPLSMLLKLSPYISELACYDIANTPGVAADLSHVRGGENGNS
jgi:malate dehydrogenase